MTPRPTSLWLPSPNFTRPKAPRRITAVILHATASAGIDSPKNFLRTPEAKASAHYLIGLDGQIIQLVQETDIAWHAGYSEWRGQANVNAFSIGIELVNLNDGKMPYPEAQRAACASLNVAICQDYGIPARDVTSHVSIVAGRTPAEKAQRLLLHSDPQGFPWEEYRAMLATAGVV